MAQNNIVQTAGNSYLAPISPEQVSISNVTFEPRCHNNWHKHKATKVGGQMLIGSAADSWSSHLAIEISGENTSNEWLEPVTYEKYDKLK